MNFDYVIFMSLNNFYFENEFFIKIANLIIMGEIGI